MNKEITILSSEESFENNYGAALQGYALYKTVQELGFAPQFVRYRGGRFDKRYRWFSPFGLKRLLGRMYRKLLPSATETRRRKLRQRYKKQIKEREMMFRRFAHMNMTFWNKERVGWWSLKRKHPITDMYICGSDQIWNPYFKNERNDPGYFLAFAPKGAKKIAYASSFGCSDLPEAAKTDIKELLSDFTAISVREESGIDIVRKYAQREAKMVLDPTLLRTPEQWKEMARLPEGMPDQYILCYRFAEFAHTKDTIEGIARWTNLPVVSLSLSDESLKDDFQKVFHAGPQEFVGLIQNAALVCTDSFHATVFSILMKTPVCVFLRENYANGNSMNSRVHSLLKLLELDHLIVGQESSAQYIEKVMQEDYSRAHEILAQKRKESIAYLENALFS